MEPISFVNLHGERVYVSDKKNPAKREVAKEISYHKWYRVTGFSPAHIDAARAKRKEDIRLALDLGSKLPPDFDPDKYMRSRNGFPVRSKPYELREAAEQCAEMARKDGWLRVEVVELKKEVRSKSGELVLS